jgi:4-hydroxythreonine-4-phosphate dehydrogenase
MSGPENRLGLMLGDPSGIGPELVARLLSRPDLYKDLELVVIGDARWLAEGQKLAGTSHPIPVVKSLEGTQIETGNPVLLDFPTLAPGDCPMGKVTEAAGRATFDTLSYTVELARTGAIGGFVFAPLNKEAMHLGGNPYNSELSFFRSVFEMPEISNELNFLDELWTTRVTSHIGLEDVPPLITKERVLETIRFMDEVLKDYGHSSPEIAVAALNPHAGEHGLFGRQEIEQIGPAVEAAKAEGIDARGPFPADTLFLRVRTEGYHGVVSMYHDQGQIAMKLMGFDRGVTVAGGLPVPIATPAHGTAHDIAGQGKANPGATITAFEVAKKMLRNKATAKR